MNELGQWALTVLAGIVVGVVSGLLSAMAWFRASKTRIYVRLDEIDHTMARRMELMEEANDRRHDKVEVQIHDLWKADHSHAVQLSVLTTCQANISAALVDLKNDSEKQNDKLDQLLREQRRA